MLHITTLASGSSGNCLVVSDGTTHILIDAGISARRITTALKDLGIDPKELAAVLVTHEHSDHISGLATLTKQLAFPLYTAGATGRQLCYRLAGLEDRIHGFQPGARFSVGGLEIGTFPTVHDCASPVGYSVTDSRGVKLAVATDLGVVTDAVREGVRGARLLVAEANYDPETLRWGSYPPFLKERILSEHGHLSNEMGGELARFAVEQGARQIILGHLSQENNTPQMAYAAVERTLTGAGVRGGTDASLRVASRSTCEGWLQVE